MLIEFIKNIVGDNQSVSNMIEKHEITSKTTLLREGEISKKIYFIKHGALRMWFNKDGKDITFQFFFEGRVVASIDSFLNNTPSMFNIESIEPCEIESISKTDFETILKLYPSLKDELFNIMVERFQNYTHLFLSRIKDTPWERYEELIKTHPDIIKRVAQHYIASYLGITPISLSRIKNRK